MIILIRRENPALPVSDERSDALSAETAKCTLLRANRHGKDHYEVSGGARTVIDEMRDVDE